MTSIQIIRGDFQKELKLPIAEGVKAGFPSPAEDYIHETLDFNHDLIRNPEATYAMETLPLSTALLTQETGMLWWATSTKSSPSSISTLAIARKGI